MSSSNTFFHLPALVVQRRQLQGRCLLRVQQVVSSLEPLGVHEPGKRVLDDTHDDGLLLRLEAAHPGGGDHAETEPSDMFLISG